MIEDLRSLIEFASANIDKIFRRSGMIIPMYHVIKSNGQNTVFVLPQELEDKDAIVNRVKELFIEHDVEMYVFIAEAWIVVSKRDDVDTRTIRHHPDRREIVMFNAENNEGEMLTASRYILRPEVGKPTLTPLKIDDMNNRISSGRMVGLLRRKQ